MRALVFLIPFLIIQSLSVADDSAARIIEGSCGDHWFKIHFKANEQTKAAIRQRFGLTEDDTSMQLAGQGVIPVVLPDSIPQRVVRDYGQVALREIGRAHV